MNPYNPTSQGALASGVLTLPATLLESGTLHCTGQTCSVLGFSPSVVVPLSLSPNLVLSGFASVGSYLYPTITFSNVLLAQSFLGSLSLTGTITAQEVGRHVVSSGPTTMTTSTTTTTTAPPTTTTTTAPPTTTTTTSTTTTTLRSAKVAICHRSADEGPAKTKTIRVSASALSAHLAHDDSLGACQ